MIVKLLNTKIMKEITDHMELIQRLSTEDINKLHDHLTDALDILYNSCKNEKPSEMIVAHKYVYGAFFLQSVCKVVLNKRMYEGTL